MTSTNSNAILNDPKLMWADPDAGIGSGMLLSDRIRFYVEQVGLIHPFEDSRLGPASYALAIGPEYWFVDDAKTSESNKSELRPGETLRIPPNSIVFVSTAETLNLPFYIAARFNLKLKLIYEGLLVGAGPQMDPGFRGRLSCPLHNISDQPVYVNAGETFAIIDFMKTTPFAENEVWSDDITYAGVRHRGEEGLLKGKNGLPSLTFPSAKLDRQPILSYLPVGKSVSSSVAGLDRRIQRNEAQLSDGLKKLEDAAHRVNLIAFVTVVVITISLGTYFYAAVNWGRTMREDAIKTTEQQLAQQKQEMGKRISDLEEKLKQSQDVRQNENARTSKASTR